ncbi:putative CtpA-like serine protease [Thalassoglobus neptunius]|uniref:Putative CtpA-like serine protease n=2 Tax=Thalassoglobus neptunius TaxID=1938619 RepID=A0A5C5W935_9PLAN|nr:putative CtpA-like serine protease [Thalassoglobus neptunius]
MGISIVSLRNTIGIPSAILFLMLSSQLLRAAEDFAVVDVQSALRNGEALESEKDWSGAIKVYESALEQFSNDETLKLRLRYAKLNFSIERRYLDDSFQTTLKPMSQEAALSLYDDVLTNVQSYFVSSISVSTLVSHGTESLWLALGHQRFIDENLFGASPERIEKLRRKLYDLYWNNKVKPVNHRFDAQSVVREVCKLCDNEIGLSSGPVIMEYCFGAFNCLDDYSSILTPGRRKDLYGNIKGEFVGIGIVMESESGKGMALKQVLPESPAAEQGLKRGDMITAVDGTDCRNLTTQETADLLTGKAGSSVQLTINRDGFRTFQVTCQRRQVQIKSVAVAKIIDSQNGIAYIQMTGFQQNTVREMDEALQKLHQQGMRALIWDVRENPGGLLTAAIEVLDRFIDEGVIVSTKGRVSDQNATYRARQNGTWGIPIVLLIDENSASASEIVAGAIKDHRRGTVVGRKSYGKWSVQTIFDARFGTSIRLTTARFYSPNGSTWGSIGLEPDVVVDHGSFERPIGDVDVYADPDIQAAMKILTQPEFTQR